MCYLQLSSEPSRCICSPRLKLAARNRGSKALGAQVFCARRSSHLPIGEKDGIIPPWSKVYCLYTCTTVLEVSGPHLFGLLHAYISALCCQVFSCAGPWVCSRVLQSPLLPGVWKGRASPGWRPPASCGPLNWTDRPVSLPSTCSMQPVSAWIFEYVQWLQPSCRSAADGSLSHRELGVVYSCSVTDLFAW